MIDSSLATHTERPSLRWDVWDLLLISIATIFLVVIGNAAIMGVYLSVSGQMTNLPALMNGELDASVLLENSWVIAGIASLNFFSVVIAMPIAMLLRNKLSWDLLGFRRFSLWWLLILPVVFMTVYPTVNLVVSGLQMALYDGLDQWQMDMLLPDDFSWPSAIALIFSIGVLVPIGEELIFRSMLYRWLRDKWGTTVGVIVSSLVFGSLHLSIGANHVYNVEFTVAIGVTLIGVALALVYQFSGSVWTAILMHMAQNTLGISVGLYFIYSGASL